MRRAAALLAALLVAVLAAAPVAGGAQTPGSAVATPGSAAAQPSSAPNTSSTATTAPDPNALTTPTRLDKAPAGHRMTGEQVRRIADRIPKIVKERRKYPGSYSTVFMKGPVRWQVSYYAKQRKLKEIGQVIIGDATGDVIEDNVGFKVAWSMARGYPGAFGRKVNSPLVWIPLTLLFVLPFLHPRRGLRMLHLDLLVLVAFGISVAFFNDAQINWSVPLVYPLLVYLLGRMLWVGLRRPRAGDRTEREAIPLLIPASWLAIALIFLLGFRVGLNVTNSNVIDVGYAGVIGADRLADGDRLYGEFPKDNPHGDTYGPVAYEAYVPFEQAMPWKGRWDDLPAAHGAAIAFDLLCVALLFLIGRRMRGPTLGIVLAYAWTAYPFTLYVSNTNSNDALVALGALLAVFLAGSPVGRGTAAALGGLSKFASLALAPLLWTHGARRGDRAYPLAAFVLAFAGTALITFVPLALHGDSLRAMYDQTLGFQAGRGSPFSIWGLYHVPGLQHVWQAIAVLLAVGLAFVRRRPDIVGLAACCAAVLIALELGLTHWFYLYIVWFFPLVMIALLGRYAEPGAELSSTGRAAARSPQPVEAVART